METRTLTKKTVSIYFAIAFVLNKAFTVIGNYIVFYLYDLKYDVLEGTGIASYYSDALMSVATFVINILTIAMLIILGNKLTGNKIRTILFVGCYYFGTAFASLFSSFITNVFQYLMIHFISASTGSTIINIGMFLTLIPAIYASYMAFTALEGVNEKVPAHPMTISLSQARTRYIISFLVTSVISGSIVSVPSFLIALINPDAYTFASYALNFLVYLVQWLSVVISFAVVYIIGYKSTKSHFGAISFYLPASALSVPVTALIGSASGIITRFLNYANQMKMLEAEAESDSLMMIAGNFPVVTVITLITGFVTVAVGFVISFKAFELFYTNTVQGTARYTVQENV